MHQENAPGRRGGGLAPGPGRRIALPVGRADLPVPPSDQPRSARRLHLAPCSATRRDDGRRPRDVWSPWDWWNGTRVSQNVRLYQFATPADPRARPGLAPAPGPDHHRPGRLLVSGRSTAGVAGPPSEGLLDVRRRPGGSQRSPNSRQRVHSTNRRRGHRPKAI